MSFPLPLTGRRILVTRTQQQASRLAEALESVGAEVLRLPTIEIIAPETYAPLDACLQEIERFDWLVVTSANGAAALGGRLDSLGILPVRLAHLQIAAIGPATRSALERIGLPVAVMPAEYVAEAVVSLIKNRVAGLRVLMVRAAVARDVIPDQLRHYGAEVDVVEAYRTVIPVASIDLFPQLLGEGKPLPDAVTFTSASTVHHFCELLAAANVSRPATLRAVSIGPITSAALRAHDWEPEGEAVPHDIPGLVNACIRMLGVGFDRS